ncbi:MAG: PilW family protein [Betaproteobacteria bacterium]|nr:PilW family protein [Betaproteobacteria bacterium]MBI2510267.1 PilW family protein [Betaproteobacteria bacterium]
MTPRNGNPRPRPPGFSIVELMVAALIGLIGSIVIFQVFAVSEGQKRTTVSGGDAQQSGVHSLFTVERDARMAGYGINIAALLGCTIVAYNATRTPTNFSFKMVPLEIIDGAGGAPDSISFMFGDSDLLMAPAKITQTMPSPAATYKVDNRYGFVEGDLVIAAELGKNCTLAQVTGVPGTPGQTDNVLHNSGNYTNAQGANVPANYNPPGGLGITYTAWDNTTNTGGRLYNLGAAPAVVTYSIDAPSSKLVYLNSLSAATPTPIVDDIIQLQALYGKDTDADGDVDAWDVIPPVTAAQWSSIIALRVAVVARSALPERPNPATGVCDITTVQPAWAGGTLVINTDPNWQCYRYRAYETVVPLRNLIWKPE